jgi:CHAT domain-containing protein
LTAIAKRPDLGNVLTYDDKLSVGELARLVRMTRFRGRPVEMLTLSACETAAGDERAALGMAGLALLSGARSALATLWRVHEQCAAPLIGRRLGMEALGPPLT